MRAFETLRRYVWFVALALGCGPRLGPKGAGSLLLQLVPEKKTDLKNRAHIDITVTDVGHAVDEVLNLGGSFIREPALYPETNALLEQAIVVEPSKRVD
jgi:hypothetical protein